MAVLDLNPRLASARRKRHLDAYRALFDPSAIIAANLRLMWLPSILAVIFTCEMTAYWGTLARSADE